MPPIPVVMGMMAAPGMVTMSASHVAQDETTGATYLDTVTTSIGRVSLSAPEDEIIMLGPKIEDVMTSSKGYVDNHHGVARQAEPASYCCGTVELATTCC